MRFTFRRFAAVMLAAMMAFVGCDQSEVDDLNKTIDDLNKTIEELQSKAAEAEDIMSLKGQVDALKALVEQYNNELKAKIADAQNEQKAQYDELSAKYAALNEQLTIAKNQFAESVASLSAIDNDLQAQLHAVIEDYNKKISDVVKDFNEGLNTLASKNAEQDGLIANLQATCAALAAQIAQAGDDYATLTTTLETFKAEVTGTLKALETRLTQAEAAIKNIEAAITAMQETIFKAEDAIAANTSDINTLKAWSATTDAVIAEMRALIENLSKTMLTDEDLKQWTDWATALFATKDDISSLEELFNRFSEMAELRFADLEANNLQIWAAIDALQGGMGGGDESVWAAIQGLQTMDEYLTGYITQLNTDIQNQYVTITNEYVALVNGVMTQMDNSIANCIARLDEVKAELSSDIEDLREEMLAADEALDAAIEAAVGRIEALEAAADELMEYVDFASANLSASIDALNKELSNRVIEIYGSMSDYYNELCGYYEDCMGYADEQIDTAVSAVYAYIEDLLAFLTERIDFIESILQDMNGDLNSLLYRVQSVEFVPRYTDGYATIDYVWCGVEYIECNSVLEYEVRPMGCAHDIVEAYNAGSLQADYVLERVQTRNTFPYDVVDALEVVGMTYSGSRLFVTVMPKGITWWFFDNPWDNSFAGALHLTIYPKYESASNVPQDFTTSFVTFWPGKFHELTLSEFRTVQVDEMGNEEILPAAPATECNLSHTWDDKVDIAVGVQPLFQIDGGEELTLHMLQDMGYNISLNEFWWNTQEIRYDGGITPYYGWSSWDKFAYDEIPQGTLIYASIGIKESLSSAEREELVGYGLKIGYVFHFNHYDTTFCSAEFEYLLKVVW